MSLFLRNSQQMEKDMLTKFAITVTLLAAATVNFAVDVKNGPKKFDL